MLRWEAAEGRGGRGSGARSAGKGGAGEVKGETGQAKRSARVRRRSHCYYYLLS